MNPVFQRFGGQQHPQQAQQSSNPFGNLMSLLPQLEQYRSNFQGNPTQQVQQLLDSGKMTKSQLDFIMPIAKTIQNMLHWN